jgi:hypothetical protein
MDWNKTVEMRTGLVIILMVACGSVQAQTFSEWFQQKKTQIAYYTEQVAALKAYSELLVQGYAIVRDGLQVVSDIKNGDFGLHNAYFSSLRQINEAFHTDDATAMYENVIRQCKHAATLSAYLPADQAQYVLSVAGDLQQKAAEQLRQYALLTTTDHYELSDEERLKWITECFTTLDDQYAFAKMCCRKVQVMLLQLSGEKNDVNGMQQIYRP